MTHNALCRPSTTPSATRRPHRPHGAHPETVLTSRGPTPPEPVALREEGTE